jgi:hypothetical protein
VAGFCECGGEPSGSIKCFSGKMLLHGVSSLAEKRIFVRKLNLPLTDCRVLCGP